jgi:hypothetical protein
MTLVLGVLILINLTIFITRTWAARPYGMSEFLYRLGKCETGLNFRHDSGSYEGFVGWYTGTWLLDRYPGMPYHAHQATPRQQIRVAYRSIARGRFFGCAVNSPWVRAAR